MSSTKRRKVQYDLSAYSNNRYEVVKQTFAKRFPTSSSKLQAPVLIDKMEKIRDTRQKEGNTRYFIRYNITDTTEAETFFNTYEKMAVTYTINSNSGIEDTELDQIQRRLILDPVGIKDPDYSDQELYTIHTTIQVAPSTDASAAASATAPAGPPTPAVTRSRSGTSTTAPSASSGPPPTGPMPSLVNQTDYQKTQLCTKLAYCQRQVYIFLRANLGEYMDHTARNLFKAHMERETEERIKDNSINDVNFFDKDKRYSWEKIKTWVSKTMCCKPRHGDTIVAFRTAVRDDNSILPLWLAVVNNMYTRAKNAGKEYEMVAKDEAVYLATRWIMPAERNLLENVSIRLGTQQEYPTFNDMAKKMTLEQLIEYANKIVPEKLPANFSASKSKRANDNKLFTLAELNKRISDAVKDKDAKISELKNKVMQANRQVDYMNRRQKVFQDEKRRQKQTNPDVYVPKVASTVKVEDHPNGLKSHPSYCQKCWDLGMKRKHHEDNCNPEMQKRSLERRQRDKERHEKSEGKANNANKGSNAKSAPSSNKGNDTRPAVKAGAASSSTNKSTRRYPLDQYLDWHCEHCKREDVAPHACRHKPTTCFRRPGGELDKEGIKDAAGRNKRSRELSAEIVKKRLGTAKRAVKITRSVRIASCSQSQAEAPPPRKRSRLHASLRPQHGWSAEEKTRLAPPNKWFGRYLLSKEFIRNPITPKEMCSIIPRDLQDSDFMPVLATNYFGREGSQLRLWNLRHNPNHAIRLFRVRKYREIEQVRESIKAQKTAKAKPSQNNIIRQAPRLLT